MKNIEREYKWDAAESGAFERFVQAVQEVSGELPAAQLVRNTDYYLEDPSGIFANQQVALRIRRSDAVWEATLKTRTILKNGLACRKEFTIALPSARNFRGAYWALSSLGHWKGYPVSSLQVRFVIKNKRTVYLLSYQGCVCEIALDNYLTVAEGHQWRRKEIEMELKKGSAKQFAKLTKLLSQKSGLLPAKISKVAGAEKWIKSKFRLN